MTKKKFNFSLTVPAVLGLLIGYLVFGIVGAILGFVLVVYVMNK
jgi:predicted PurR-regulated permease PerM